MSRRLARRAMRRRQAAEDRRVRAFVWAIRESSIPGHTVEEW
jgi:hypothetical protein